MLHMRLALVVLIQLSVIAPSNISEATDEGPTAVL